MSKVTPSMPSDLVASSGGALTDLFMVEESAGTLKKMTLTQLQTLLAGSDGSIRNATPSQDFYDTDCTDADINAQILAAATATGSGAEDTDLSIKAQIGGTLTEFFFFDASDKATYIAKNSTAKLGFYGVTPVTRPTAYTQTYSTADKTHAAPTATALTDNTAGTANTTLQALADGSTYANDVAAIRNNFADLAASNNAIIVDLADVKQLVNSVIDDLQALGLLQ